MFGKWICVFIFQQKRAQTIQKELEEQAETNVEVQGSYQSLHEETATKEKKLKQVNNKLITLYIHVHVHYNNETGL